MDAAFYLRLFLAALIIIGIWNAFAKGMILGRLGDWLEDRWYGKPIGLCPPCAASLYGTATWFATGGDWWWWLPFVLALSGFMKLIAHNLLRNG